MWIETFKCRCSGISKIMAVKKGCEPISEVQLRRISELEARTKAMTPNMEIEYAGLVNKRDNPPPKQLADGCIEYLMEVYSWNEHGTIPVGKESKEIMQLEKGKKVEKSSIELLSVVEDVYYEQHKDRIFNDYLSGQIDCYLGKSVYEATNITDIKSSFDQPSFLKKIHMGLENGQREQVAGYCAITGASEGYIANCLVDNPDEDIEEMKFRLAKKMGCLTTESPEFLEEWKKWYRSMKFGHTPAHQRVFKIPVELFSKFELEAVYDQVKYCREWLFKFDEMYKNLNK